jgi:hypothetical protein
MNYTITIEEDPETGELILPFSDEMLAQVGWNIGDTLVWKDEGNGAWSLSKKTEHSQFYYDTERNK